MDFDAITDADLICLSVFAPALTKARGLGRMIMQRKPALPVIMGGPQVCYFTDTVLDCCTYAVRTEGDEVLPRLIECLNNGGEVQSVPGISYMHGGHIVHNPAGSPFRRSRQRPFRPVAYQYAADYSRVSFSV
jgi:hypothetical protein